MGDMNVNYDSRETISNLLEFISAYHPDEAIRKTALGNMASRGDCAPDCIPLHIMDVAAESPHADIAIAATDKAYKLLGSRIFNEMWFSCVLNSKIPEVRLHAFDLIKKDYNVGNSCAFLNLCPGEHYPKLPKDIEALMLVHLEGKYASSLQTIWAEAPLIWLAKHSQKHGLDAYLKVHEWMVAKKHIAPTEHLSKFAADEAVRLEASKGAYLIKEANKKKSEEPAS
jgi:hypothetical protein